SRLARNIVLSVNQVPTMQFQGAVTTEPFEALCSSSPAASTSVVGTSGDTAGGSLPRPALVADRGSSASAHADRTAPAARTSALVPMIVFVAFTRITSFRPSVVDDRGI